MAFLGMDLDQMMEHGDSENEADEEDGDGHAEEQDAGEEQEESTGSDEDDNRIENDVICDHEPQQAQRNYDISLPANHAYLPEMVELAGRVVLEPLSRISLPILSLAGIVLVPGQILPLQVELPSLVSVIKAIVLRDRTFGICTSNEPHAIGTTAEIRSFAEDESYGLPIVRVKAEGRQRFIVESTWRQTDAVLMATVQICPENDLRHPHQTDLSLCSRGYKHNKRLLSAMTPFPAFLYRMYDPAVLMKHIERHLESWANNAKTETRTQTQTAPQDSSHELLLTRTITTLVTTQRTPKPPRTERPPQQAIVERSSVDDNEEEIELVEDGEEDEEEEVESDGVHEDDWEDGTELGGAPKTPLEYSYWVAKNLPLEDEQRMQLLSIQSPIQRLRCELHLLEKYVFLCCSNCKSKICSRDDVFSMSLAGPQAAYMNPGGIIHETLTVLKASSLLLVGRSSTEQSWFPGYAWTICTCVCNEHMGWKFTATNKIYQPQQFWGITRAAIEPGFKIDPETDDLKSPLVM